MRNKVKRRMGFILVIAMLIVMIYPGESGSASEESDGFAIENGVLTGYVGVENAVNIPDTVTAIGDSAFQSTSITSVNIPGSVTSIGSYAFAGCSALTSVTIPASVGSMGTGVFHGCTSLGSITLQSGAAIPDNAFTDCLSLTSVTLSTAIPSIGSESFKNCESLSTIVIPASVSSIASNAFDGCANMSAINIDSGNAFYTSYEGVLYSSNGVALYRCPQGSMSMTIHDGTQVIEGNAFYGCKLGTVKVPGSVTRIALNAFTGSEIQTLILPSSVSSFEDQAFIVNAIEVPADSPIVGQLKEEYGSIVNTGSNQDTETPDTETETPTPPDTETETPTPPDTETETPTPPDTETETPTPPDTETETPTPPDTETETPTPPDTETPSVSYKIIEGADGTYSGSGTYTIRADGEFSKFKNVAMDGKTVDTSKYEAKSGSTIITFKENYMKSLGAGSHTITVNFEDGSAKTSLKVNSKNDNNGNGGSDNSGGSNGGSQNGNNGASNGNTGTNSQGTVTANVITKKQNPGTVSTSHTKDKTPKTGPEENAKYILCLGVMLLGVYMILTSRKENYQTAS